MAIAEHNRLKRERSLDNLEVRQLDLRQSPNQGRTFDLIFSTGVLHHLEQTEEGLRALAAVLDHRGAMIVMLYGSVARVGVYLLQDAFKRMGLVADQEGVELARRMLSDLPKHQFFHWYSLNAPDLKSDAGLVDTLLNAQDRFKVGRLITCTSRRESSGHVHRRGRSSSLFRPMNNGQLSRISHFPSVAISLSHVGPNAAIARSTFLGPDGSTTFR
jgi:SAM-dependent methyltransferase